MTTQEYYAPKVWFDAETGIAERVVITVRDGLIDTIDVDTSPPPQAIRLPGFVIPGLVNCHSHVFHRALRGRTHRGNGDFWSWRDQMYTVLPRLNPHRYRKLAQASYAEMLLAGITTVVEFHYLTRSPTGEMGGSPTVMDSSLMDASATADIGLVLLNTCYLQADVAGSPLSGAQQQFDDKDVTTFLTRISQLLDTDQDLGIGIHSVRGCPPAAMREIAKFAQHHELPLHIHLSEQLRENQECLETYGVSPTQLCADTGVLGPRTTAIHATHLDETDIRLLGESSTIAGFCPTTERDLADGIGPAAALRKAGSPLALGTDSHAVIDLFEDARAVELNERLATQTRGLHSAVDLLSAATAGGAASAGLAASRGRIKVGFDADFIALDTESVRLAGADDPIAATVFAATTSDVTHVVRHGRLVVDAKHHTNFDDVGAALGSAITDIYSA